MFSNKYLFLILVVFGIVFAIENDDNNAYGHGITSEVLQSEILEGQGFTLNLYSSTSPTEQNHREIYFELMDSKTDELINEVTFLINISQNEKTILENSFQSDDGILILDMNMNDDTFSKIIQRDSELDDPQKLKNAKMKNIPNLQRSNVLGH